MDELELFFSAVRQSSPSGRALLLKAPELDPSKRRSRLEGWLQAHDSIAEWAIGISATPGDAPVLPDVDAALPGLLAEGNYDGSLGRLLHYEVIRVLAVDAMGVKLEAFDTHLDRIVAIKVLSTGQREDTDRRQRFVDEARRLAAVLHPNVVRVLDVGELGGTPFAVWEYVDGQSMSRRMATGQPFSVPEIKRIALQIVDGLSAMHAAGLVHRGINPGNVRLCGVGEFVKIANHGMAGGDAEYRVIHRRLSAEGDATASATEPADARSDLYDLGALLYQMAAGGSVSDACESDDSGKRSSFGKAVPPIEELSPELPSWLATTINQLLTRNPSERFQSAQDLARLLRSHTETHESTSRPRDRRSQWWRRLKTAVLLLAATLMAGVATLLFLVQLNFVTGPPRGITMGVGHIQVECDDPDVILAVTSLTTRITKPPSLFVENNARWHTPPSGYLVRGYKNGVIVYEEEVQVGFWDTVRLTYVPNQTEVDQQSEPNLAAARWILSRGGEVTEHWSDGQLVTQTIGSSDRLPESGFQLKAVRVARLKPEESAAVFGVLARCSRLTDLELVGRPMTGEVLRELHAVSSLQRIVLAGLENVDVHQYRMLGKLPYLRSLSLSYSANVDAFVAALGAMPQLKEVSIDDSPLTDELVKTIAANDGLEALSIESRFVTDDAIDTLAKLPSLTRLTVRSPLLTDRIWEKLASMSRLESLTLGGYPCDLPMRVNHQVTCEGARSLESLPALQEVTLCYAGSIDRSSVDLTALAEHCTLTLEACSREQPTRPWQRFFFDRQPLAGPPGKMLGSPTRHGQGGRKGARAGY